MGKGGPVKSIEAIYKLARDKMFRAEVKRIRNKPHGGTLLDTMELLKKHHLPPAYYWEMQQYVMHGKINEARSEEEAVMTLKYPNDPSRSTGNEQAFEKLEQPYVSLYIHEASSKDDVVRLISKNWRHIRASLKAQGSDVSRVRTSKNKERNLLISLLGEKTKDELCKEAGMEKNEWPGYTALVIERLMKEKYGYPEVTFEMVRKYLATPKRATDNS
jgi:hypothetical protein